MQHIVATWGRAVALIIKHFPAVENKDSNGMFAVKNINLAVRDAGFTL